MVMSSDLSGLIAVFDTDGDGTVTLQEFKAALQVSAAWYVK